MSDYILAPICVSRSAIDAKERCDDFVLAADLAKVMGWLAP